MANDQLKDWAKRVRTAASWHSGPRQIVLEQLADEIDPDVENPPADAPVPDVTSTPLYTDPEAVAQAKEDVSKAK